jgi:hypothetical protein
MSENEIIGCPSVDSPVAAILAALRQHDPRASVTEIVRRVEMDGKVSETRVRLCSSPSNEDAA